MLVTPVPGTTHPDQAAAIVVEPATPAAHDDVAVVERAASGPTGAARVEVVVEGWRFLFDVEDAELADLRARAARVRPGSGGGGSPVEIRAIIPGRVVGVAVNQGDEVEAGQALLVVEAMKMQNELRAPRSGTVQQVHATVGATIEIGELLVVLA